MKDLVLITGSGMIAKRLAVRLIEKAYSVRFLSRQKKGINCYKWSVEAQYIEKGALVGVTHIVHLAGENIASKRWRTKRKQELIASRVNSARLLLKMLKKENRRVETFISASGVGYYGVKTTSEIFEEEGANGQDFLASVCKKWEKSATDFEIEKVAKRVIKLRLGVVLSNQGGALCKILTPIKYYLGAVIGSGKQYIPWIHIDDLCDIVVFGIEKEDFSGVFNSVATETITNKQLTFCIAKKIGKRIVLPAIPKFVMRLILGEMSLLLTEGSRVSSKRLQAGGYVFKYSKLMTALEDLLKKD